MPYITAENRRQLDAILDELLSQLLQNPSYEGNLNYSISYLLNGLLSQNFCYAEVNRAIGALECAKLELYRRVAAPYEDVKAQENGDVYFLE